MMENEDHVEVELPPEVNLPVIALEQCTLCSAHYEQGRRNFPRPDVNRMIVKLLDAAPPLPADRSSFLNTYIPICIDCVRKVKRYDKLRLELEALRREVATSVVETLVHIRPDIDTPLEPIKQLIVQKWVSHDGQVGYEPAQLQPERPQDPSFMPVTPIRKSPEKRTPKPKSPQRQRPVARVIQSPPKTVEEAIQRQRSFGQFDASKLPITSAQNEDDPANWVNSVSIVAENEAEARAILAAVSSEAERRDEEEQFEVVDPDDSYFDVDYSPCAEEEQVTASVPKKRKRRAKAKNRDDYSPGAEEEQDTAPKKRKHRAKNWDDPNRVKRERAKYVKLPQHMEQPFFCEQCGRVFMNLGTLRNHTLLCQGPEESEKDKPITCSMCPVEVQIHFPDWIALKFHINEIHPDFHVDKCRFCKKDFLPNTFLGHKCVRSADVPKSDPDYKKLKCSFCSKEYFKLHSLNVHVLNHHAEEERFRCDICKRDFSAQVILDRHAKKHVTDMRTPYKCEVCGICITSKPGFRSHMRIHTGERPFACEICGLTFRLYNIRKNHMVVHTKERNFACELCGMTFTLYATMLRHWKKCRAGSSRKKGKWCPICLSDGSIFLKLKTLQEHMLKQHPGTKEQFEVCKETEDREFGFEAESVEEAQKLKALRPKRPEGTLALNQKKARIRVRVKKEVTPTPDEAEADEDDPDFLPAGMSSEKATASPTRRSSREPKKKLEHDDVVDPNAVDSEAEAESILPDDSQQQSDEEEPPTKRTALSSHRQRLIHKKKRIKQDKEDDDSDIEDMAMEDDEEDEEQSPAPTPTMTTRNRGLKEAKIVVQRINSEQRLRGSKS